MKSFIMIFFLSSTAAFSKNSSLLNGTFSYQGLVCPSYLSNTLQLKITSSLSETSNGERLGVSFSKSNDDGGWKQGIGFLEGNTLHIDSGFNLTGRLHERGYIQWETGERWHSDQCTGIYQISNVFPRTVASLHYGFMEEFRMTTYYGLSRLFEYTSCNTIQIDSRLNAACINGRIIWSDGQIWEVFAKLVLVSGKYV